MRVFRLSKRKYATELNGKGAAKSGNRWNSKGVELIYTAESRALVMAEVAVHLTLANLPRDFVMIEIKIPDSISIDELKLKTLNKDWNSNPHTLQTQKLGDAFIDSKEACILKVPSAVVKGDFNYLINPHHSDLDKIHIVSITDFPFDKRIFE
jgi:RES domain-containing protein